MPAISATISVNASVVKIGSIPTVAIDFNQAVTGFDASDLILPGGSVSGLSSQDGGVTWTGAFTPPDAVQSQHNLIGLNLSNVMDSGGVAGPNTEVDSNDFLIDQVRPFINSVVFQTTELRPGDASLVTFHFSEAVSDFVVSQVGMQGGVLSNLTTANNVSWTATFTPNDNIIDSGVTLFANPFVR